MKVLFSKEIYLPIFFALNLLGVIFHISTDVQPYSYNFSIILSICLFLFIFAERILNLKKGAGLFEPDFIFIVIFSIFHFSYIWLYFFGISDFNREVFYNISKVSLAIYFCSFCILFFLLGYGQALCIPSNLKIQDTYSLILRMYKFSKQLIIICLVFLWLPILSVGLYIFQDYHSLISVGRLSYFGKLYFVGQFIAVTAISLYSICSGLLYNQYMAGRFRFVALFYIVSFLIIGDRGGFVSFAIIPAIAYNLFQKKISLKIFLVVILGLLTMSSYVAVSRVQSIFNPISMVTEYYNYNKEIDSPIVRALNEFGASLKTVVIAMDLVPAHYNHWYGKSYLYSLSIIVPNIFGEKRSSEGSPGAWLTETAFGSLDKTHGRGGSIAMEAYLNFGFWFGALSFFFIGLFLKWVYKSFLVKTSIVHGVLYLSSMSVFTLWMRNTSSGAFRTILWGLIIVTLLRKIILYKQN